jgi:hypothetical protein
MSSRDEAFGQMARDWEHDRAELLREIDHLRAALEAIAVPMRRDGTFNLSRDACRRIAQRALNATQGEWSDYHEFRKRTDPPPYGDGRPE